MKPRVRIAARASLVGVGAGLAFLYGNILANGFDYVDLLGALNSGYAGAMAYVGLGVFTDLEPTLGVKK